MSKRRSVMVPSVGGTEVVIFLTVVLLLFGAKRIPELAKGLGSGIREFRKGISEKDEPQEVVQDRKSDEEMPTEQQERDEARNRNARV